MSRRSRLLGEDERTLWETVAKAITPLKRRKAKIAVEASPAQPEKPAEKPKSRLSTKPALVVAPKPPAPRTEPPRLAPLDRRMKQKLARGREAIDARIDLHGMTQSEAHGALIHFLKRAQRDGARVVLVITGKGAAAGADPFAERGVLKRQVPLWLESAELRPLVVGFESAGRGHGGQGALYVRVRKARGGD